MVHIKLILVLDYPSMLNYLANIGNASTLSLELSIGWDSQDGPALVACSVGGGERRIVRRSNSSCHLRPGGDTRRELVGVFDVFGSTYHATDIARRPATAHSGRTECCNL